MADAEQNIAISVELHDAKAPDKKDDDDITVTPTDTVQSTDNNSNKKDDDDNFLQPQPSESTIRKEKMQEKTQKLRIVVEDMWSSKIQKKNIGANAGRTGSGIKNKIGGHESSLITRVTSIMIDELNDETQEFETCEITLPKSPICALLLMESVGIFQTLETVSRLSIIATILITILIQTIAGVTLFYKQIIAPKNVDIDLYQTSDCFLNLVVVSFVVIYLAQDCSGIYKMVILLRWMRSAGKLKRHAAVLIAIYLVTNVLFYVFLLYYSVGETIARKDISDKLQAAVAVYFILELDDWLYNVTIEPLKILDDAIFSLQIKGELGSRNRRFKKVSYWFWTVFFLVLIVQFLMFVTKLQEKI